MPSLRTFLIVYQNEPRIEVWRRDMDWSMEVFGPEGTIGLPEFDGSVSVSDVYARASFAEA